MTDAELADEIERSGYGTRLALLITKEHWQQIIAALRREPDSCWTTCSDCGFLYGEYHGHIIPCPRCSVEKNLRERPTSGEMVMATALALAQTEIKGHMRVVDELKFRIAELEKELARYSSGNPMEPQW